RSTVKRSLATADENVARMKALAIDAELDAYWEALLAGAKGDAEARRKAIEDLAAARGIAYLPAAELARAPITEIIARLERLESRGELSPEPAAEPALEAELGLAPPRKRSPAEALEAWIAATPDRRVGKSQDQVHRALNPRRKAIRNLQKVIGTDLAFEDVGPNEAADFRAHLAGEIAAGRIGANAANKDIGHLSDIWRTLARVERSGLANPFERMRFTEEAEARLPIPAAFVAERWLERDGVDPLGGMNAEARAILLGLVETGLRPSELIGADAGEIVTEGDAPHVIVRPNRWRAIKTRASRRTVPLAGLSLEALRGWEAGFPRYRGKPAHWSNAVNKFLRGNGLLPSPDHSAYGLRHAFEDRLIEVDCPERTKATLMGHKLKGRPCPLNLLSVLGWGRRKLSWDDHRLPRERARVML
ncbi:MAG: tyrosine-type recombinase/integrase, partial [Pseudomonadota bacterium]